MLSIADSRTDASRRFPPRDLELALPGQEHEPGAHQPQAAGDLSRRVDPGVLADHSDLVDTDLDLDGVVEAVDRDQLLADAGLRERSGAVLVGDVGEHAGDVLRLESLNGPAERRPKRLDGVGRRDYANRLGGEHPNSRRSIHDRDDADQDERSRPDGATPRARLNHGDCWRLSS